MSVLHNILGAAYDARWILVAIAFLALVALLADAYGLAAAWKKENDALAAENTGLRRQLRQRPRIVALPPRKVDAP